MADAPVDYLGMDDDAILAMNGPSGAPAAESEAEGADTVVGAEGVETVNAEAGADTIAASGGDDTLDGGSGSDTVAASEGDDTIEGAAASAKAVEKPSGEVDPKGDPKDPTAPKVEPKKDEPTGSAEGKTVTVTPEQAIDFYAKVMAPFKANGKTIQLKSPEEMIQLMQMGANYTRKMQDIQPHRKMLLMLENNGLLDEGKLSYLIDLDRKNPEAIKKLVKDAGIDPMDIDNSVDPKYLPGDHQVSDAEATFREVLEDVRSHPTGQETINIINSQWDNASKEALWADPKIASAIHEQRENGIYAVITEELDRQKTLGQIPANTPFLQAYKVVGDKLAEAGAFDNLSGAGTVAKPEGQPANVTSQEPVAVATRVAAPKSPVANGDKAGSAAPTRTTTRQAEKFVNPLAMSDADFEKLTPFKNRV